MSLDDFDNEGKPTKDTNNLWVKFSMNGKYSVADRYRYPNKPTIEVHDNRYALTAFILGCLLCELEYEKKPLDTYSDYLATDPFLYKSNKERVMGSLLFQMTPPNPMEARPPQSYYEFSDHQPLHMYLIQTKKNPLERIKDKFRITGKLNKDTRKQIYTNLENPDTLDDLSNPIKLDIINKPAPNNTLLEKYTYVDENVDRKN